MVRRNSSFFFYGLNGGQNDARRGERVRKMAIWQLHEDRHVLFVCTYAIHSYPYSISGVLLWLVRHHRPSALSVRDIPHLSFVNDYDDSSSKKSQISIANFCRRCNVNLSKRTEMKQEIPGTMLLQYAVYQLPLHDCQSIIIFYKFKSRDFHPRETFFSKAKLIIVIITFFLFDLKSALGI